MSTRLPPLLVVEHLVEVQQGLVLLLGSELVSSILLLGQGIETVAEIMFLLLLLLLLPIFLLLKHLLLGKELGP